MLTAKQHELIRFIQQRLEETGISPSFEEMKEALDLKTGEYASARPAPRISGPAAKGDLGDRLIAALFAGPEPVALKRDYLATLPGTEAWDALTGQPPADRPDPGPLVCSCFNVGVNTILAAIESQGLVSVEQIGAALEAGTNCGSCRPELAAILAAAHAKEAAQ